MFRKTGHIPVCGIAADPYHVINKAHLDFHTKEGAIDRYRILMLDQSGEVAGFTTCDATTDAAALSIAGRWLGKQRNVEVWRGPHLVGILSTVAHSGAATACAD